MSVTQEEYLNMLYFVYIANNVLVSNIKENKTYIVAGIINVDHNKHSLEYVPHIN